MRVDIEDLAVGRRLTATLILDAVLDRELGADQRLPAQSHQIGIVIGSQRTWPVNSGVSAVSRMCPNFSGLVAMILRTDR